MKQIIWNFSNKLWYMMDTYQTDEYLKFLDIRFIINAFGVFWSFHRILRKTQGNTLNIFYCGYI